MILYLHENTQYDLSDDSFSEENIEGFFIFVALQMVVEGCFEEIRQRLFEC